MRRALLALLCMGCGPSVESWVRPDWPTVDQTRVKRISVVVAPPAGQGPHVGDLWSLVTRRWVNQHRNFIVKQNGVAPSLDLPAQCAGFDGVLHLATALSPDGDGIEADLKATLYRCADNEKVWNAATAGSFEQQDEELTELAAYYGRELGAEVQPYVPAVFRTLRAVLETLPQPVLTEEDEMEKIEMGE